MSESEITAKLNDIFEDNGNGQYIFKDYTTHTMRVFYMERGAGASNLHMRFNLASVTPGHVVVSKTISGNGANELDKDFIEYPFQIYYTLPEGENGEPGEEQLLGNDSEHIRVTYQNSNQPVTFVRKYRPPGFSDEDAYQNIYFINPSKNAEISFPDETISYRIVECAVDSTVYGNVKINGEDVPPERVEIKGNLKSYSSEIGTSEKKPSIAFDNVVNDNVIKDLSITKKLLDEDDHEITDDPATFNFRLYISSVAVDERTSMSGYTVKEVTISSSSPTVAADGTVTNYGTLTPIDSAGSVRLTATRTAQATPAGENSDKDFNYVVSYTQGAGENDEFVWAKNGEEQTKMSHSGGEFTMKHGDVVEIALPQGVDVKVTEKKSEYKTTFRLGDEQDKAENSVQFTFTDSTTLVVTNTLNGNVAAGLSSPLARAVIIICVSAACIGYILCRKRKERLEQN